MQLGGKRVTRKTWKTPRETPRLVMLGRVVSNLYLKKLADRDETQSTPRVNLVKQSEGAFVTHLSSSFVFKTLSTTL